jgi:hypothetical protein
MKPIDADSESIDEKKWKRKKRSINVVLPLYEEVEPEPVLPPTPSIYYRIWNQLDRAYQYFYPRMDESFPRREWKPEETKSIVIIGIHGWFPSKIFNPVIGQPTGTSDYIATKMQKAILEHYKLQYGMEIDESRISTIFLEKQGKVEDRVESHFEQLQDWREQLTNADLIVVTAHSQGTPVSSILLSKLIEEKLVHPLRQKIGIVAMAGICHGPYPSLKSSLVIKYVEADPAKQLFDFNDPYAEVSRRFYDSMSHILHCGVRVAAIGSWYDQVVPLYSATAQGLSHPNLYRALYIDRADYQPDFLSHLVVFALKLRNYGLSDHGLVLYLSETLQGNIYGFGTQGHSAIYEEDATYSVGLTWLLGRSLFWETASKGTVLTHPPLQAITKTNPYFLPWIMARLLADTEISTRQDLKEDLDKVVSLFLSWIPTQSHLKDLKYRLEPLKSKL